MAKLKAVTKWPPGEHVEKTTVESIFPLDLTNFSQKKQVFLTKVNLIFFKSAALRSKVLNPPKAVLGQVEYLPKTHQLVDFQPYQK